MINKKNHLKSLFKPRFDMRTNSEARFVEVVRNWVKAAYRGGLSEKTRSKYNKDMNDFLLDDWMPRYKNGRGFSTDVFRPAKGIQGLTREIVVASQQRKP